MAGLTIFGRTLITASRVGPVLCKSYGQASQRNILTSARALAKQKEWVTVTYEKGGEKYTVKGKEGENLLDIAINNDVDLDGFGACEGTLACSTCHLVFSQSDFDKIEEPATDEELDMLDLAYGLTDTIKCVSLSGCGFLGFYLMGAVQALNRHIPHLLQVGQWAGASAGALLAACIVTGVPMDKIKHVFIRASQEIDANMMGAFSPKFNIENYIYEGFSMLPNDAHELANGRLHVSVTRVSDGKNCIISEWESRADLLECLRCSSFIPGWSGFRFPTFRGEKFIDGGFTNNLPVPITPSLKISPFSSLFIDICPKDKCKGNPRHVVLAGENIILNAKNIKRFKDCVMPPSTDFLNIVYTQGYIDTINFLYRKSKGLNRV
ncbi:unnamed protein product [Meganyctiphanes norvegica]|uniref:PNPLA domain-containing protein n=1 Tax=Meganyctiphanes norvegica TaxID=48144 RepID=A0AAV2QY89_MEGNR